MKEGEKINIQFPNIDLDRQGLSLPARPAAPAPSGIGTAYKVDTRYEDRSWHLLIPGMQKVVIVTDKFTTHRGFLTFMCYAGRMAAQECVVRAFLKENPKYERVVRGARKSWFCTEGPYRLDENILEALEFEQDSEGVDVYHAFLDFIADNFWNKRTFTRVMRFYSCYKLSGDLPEHRYDILVRDEKEQEQEMDQHFRRSLNSDVRFTIKIYCLETKKLLHTF